MILGRLKEFGENMMERARNPFGGTLIVSWLLNNWRLSYSIFNFDTDTKLDGRIKIIQDYIQSAGSHKLIWFPIGTAFIAVTSYLLLTSASRFIFLSFSKWITPGIYSIMDKNRVVMKSTYEDLKKAFINLRKEKEEADENLSRVYAEKQGLENNIAELESGKTAVERALVESEEANRKIQQDLIFEKDKEVAAKSAEKDIEYTKKMTEKDSFLESQIEHSSRKSKELEKKIEDSERKCGQLEIELEHLRKEHEVDVEAILDMKIIFPGIWTNTFRFQDGKEGSESFSILDKNIYAINGKPEFTLEDAILDKKNKLLSFTKKGIGNDNRIAKNTIIKIDDSSFMGLENGSTKVVYSRNKSRLEALADLVNSA